MKKIAVFVLMVQLLCYYKTSAQKETNKPAFLGADEFMITGEVKGLDTGSLVLLYFNNAGVFTKDTSILEQGAFKFRGTVKEPTNAEMRLTSASNSMNDPNRVKIFLEPQKMQMELIQGDFFNVKLTGSNTQVEFDKFHKMERTFHLISDSLEVERKKVLATIKSNGKSIETDKMWVDLNAKNVEISSKKNNVALEFIISHPNSYVSPYLLWEISDGRDQIAIDSIKSMLNNFSPLVKGSLFGRVVANKIKAKEAVVVGNTAPDFSSKDVNGKAISLQKFRNRSYVLLDFWGSWCVNCRLQTPSLKKLYGIYHSKGLEVIGIARDADRKKWKDAIEEDGIGIWHNLEMADVEPVKGEPGLEGRFDITGYPTIILMDKKGVILYRKNGYDEALGLKALEEVLLTALNKE